MIVSWVTLEFLPSDLNSDFSRMKIYSYSSFFLKLVITVVSKTLLMSYNESIHDLCIF